MTAAARRQQFLEQVGNEIANQRWLQLMPPSTEPLTPSTDVYAKLRPRVLACLRSCLLVADHAPVVVYSKTREDYIKKKYTPQATPQLANTNSSSFEPIQ
jgi:hypothetical protein